MPLNMYSVLSFFPWLVYHFSVFPWNYLFHLLLLYLSIFNWLSLHSFPFYVSISVLRFFKISVNTCVDILIQFRVLCNFLFHHNFFFPVLFFFFFFWRVGGWCGEEWSFHYLIILILLLCFVLVLIFNRWRLYKFFHGEDWWLDSIIRFIV